MESKNCAVYVILGYDVNGMKDILGIWIGESEGKHYWMQIFDEIKARGVEDVLFISMDGVSGLEEGARSIFKDVVVQRCIVHLIRNSLTEHNIPLICFFIPKSPMNQRLETYLFIKCIITTSHMCCA